MGWSKIFALLRDRKSQELLWPGKGLFGENNKREVEKYRKTLACSVLLTLPEYGAVPCPPS
jgi:hypothetical protein